MQRFRIIGGNPVRGKLRVQGAKNASLPIIAASLLIKEEVVLHDVPRLRDVSTLLEILTFMGVEHQFEGNTLIINAKTIQQPTAPYELVKQMRASILVMGPLISRLGEVEVARPGGCAIGHRPIDVHINGFKRMGVDIQEFAGTIKAKGWPKGGTIYLEERSVTGTENLIMGSVMAQNVTRLVNVALEPHVKELIQFLNKAGAKIDMEGDQVLIYPVSELHGIEYTIGPDYIEADTFMAAAAITRGDIFIEGARWEDSTSEILKLQEAGVEIHKDGPGIRVTCRRRLKGVNFKTAPYPGFPTDFQPIFSAVLTLAEGTSFVEESLYENRFTHFPELQRMGARVVIEDRVATIYGVEKLWGAPVMASDARCGAALVVAALGAEGESTIDRVYHIDRAYERLDDKLRSVGVDIERIG